MNRAHEVHEPIDIVALGEGGKERRVRSRLSGEDIFCPVVQYEWYDKIKQYRIENEAVLCRSYTSNAGDTLTNFVPLSQWKENERQGTMITGSSKYGTMI